VTTAPTAPTSASKVLAGPACGGSFLILWSLVAGSLRVMRMNEAKETYRAASAIAAFDAIQVAFAALVKKGILSKAEAEQIIREAIETIKTGGAGDQAAELLAIALEKISKFEPAPRQ
jgi:hypothetical protein